MATGTCYDATFIPTGNILIGSQEDVNTLWGKKVEAQEGKLCACLALYEVHNILLIFQYTQPLERKALSPRVGIPVEDTSLAEAQAKFWGK